MSLGSRSPDVDEVSGAVPPEPVAPTERGSSMDRHYRTTPPKRLRRYLGYGALFLIPAAAVFVLVQKHFTGLPPRHLAEMTFRIDPQLNREDSAGGSTAMMDPQSVQREIRSRHKLKEAVQGLPLYEKRDEAGRAFLLEQIGEHIRCKVERAIGEDSYLVDVAVTVPSNEPEQLEELLRRVRDVYLRHTVRNLLKAERRKLDSLRQQTKIFTDDYDLDKKRLEAFRADRDNALLIGDPPEIDTIIAEKKAEKKQLEHSGAPDAAERAAVLARELIQFDAIRDRRPTVLQQLAHRRDKHDKTKKRLEDHQKDVTAQAEYVARLEEKSRDRFDIVEGPTANPVESEQSTRLVVGLALGAMAGLFLSLIYLLVRIVTAGD